MKAASGTDSVRRIAALPMYDFPHLRDAHDTLWSALADRLISYGVTRVPLRLTRGVEHLELAGSTSLLLGQTCEYPLTIAGAADVRLVGTPRYRVAGCSGASYCSFIVVRADDATADLAGFRGRRCAINERHSNSGMNLLRAAIAPVSGGGRFFESVMVSGSHRNSVWLIAHGEADVAAIDCVSFAHLRHVCAEELRELRVLAQTPSSPCLPFISSTCNEMTTLVALRRGLAEVLRDPDLAAVRGQLLLESMDFEPDSQFTVVRRLERQAGEVGYPVLC